MLFNHKEELVRLNFLINPQFVPLLNHLKLEKDQRHLVNKISILNLYNLKNLSSLVNELLIKPIN